MPAAEASSSTPASPRFLSVTRISRRVAGSVARVGFSRSFPEAVRVAVIASMLAGLGKFAQESLLQPALPCVLITEGWDGRLVVGHSYPRGGWARLGRRPWFGLHGGVGSGDGGQARRSPPRAGLD